MKTINQLLFIVCLGVISMNQSYAQWVQTNVPSGGLVQLVTFSGDKLCVISYVPQTALYFYGSTDNGETWTGGISGERGPTALAGNGTNLFAGYFSAFGLYLSTDNGIEWESVNSFPSAHWVTTIALDGEKVLVGTMSGGVHLSLNNGIDWTSFKLGESTVSSFIFHGAYIFSGTYGEGVFRSMDDGRNWVPVNNGLTDTVITSLLAIGTSVFCGTNNGIYLSTNNGSNWVSVNYGLGNDSISSLAASGSDIFAGTYEDGIYLSTNNGANWTQINEGLTTEEIFSLTVNRDYIFAGTENGLWRRSLSEIVTDIDDQNNELPFHFALEQNYPDPFNPLTTIQYSIPSNQFVTLKVYDLLGKETAQLLNEEKSAGSYFVNFNAANLSSGIYFYTLNAGKYTKTKKLVLMK